MRRVKLFWLYGTLCLSLLTPSVTAQSPQETLGRTAVTGGFVVAPSISLPSSPTSIAAGDLNGDRSPDLVVTTKGPNVSVFLSDGNGGFKPGVSYAAGVHPGNALLADLNGDGKLDLVVTDSATGTVNILLGNGDGTFGKLASYAAIQNPVGLALGNFAGKGRIDLAVASKSGLAVLVNDGSGHFPAATPVAINSQPVSLTAADLRGAGNDDLILANQDGTVSVLLGDGNGGFHTQTASSIASGPLSAVISGDFNGDGKTDIAVSEPNSNAITVLLGRGDGTFQPGAAYSVGNGPVSIMAADFKGSGVASLITINKAANTVSILQGNGDGTFQPAIEYVPGNSPVAAVAADFSGDGHTDLAIVNSGDGTISLALGRGDGSLLAPRAYRTGLESKAIAAGDLIGNGRPDLVVANNCGSDPSCSSAGSATVFLSNANGTYQVASTILLGKGPVAVALADLNGDKKLDLLAVNRTDKTLMVLLGNGDGTFGKAQSYTLAGSPRALFVSDFNGDGNPDLAIAMDCGQETCSQAGTVDIWLSHSDGSLTELNSYPVGYSPVSIAGGNLRGTGDLDLIVANACGSDGACKSSGTATLLAGDGTGKFTRSEDIELGASPSSIAVGALTRSGLDVAVALRGSNQIAVMHANSSEGFSTPVTYAVGSAPSALVIADLNGDGNQDVAVANFQSSTVSVLNGTGNGTLQAPVTYTVGAGPESLVAVSSSASGKSSLVTANGNSGAEPLGNVITALVGGDPGTTTSVTTFTNEAITSTVDQTVTITAQVASGSPSSATIPSGFVVFAVDASANGTGAGPFTDLSDCGGSTGLQLSTETGTVTCTTQTLPAGNPTYVQLQYLGDPTYAASTSEDQGETIAQANTSLQLISSGGGSSGPPPTTGTSSLGSSVTFTATVSAPAGAAVALSGSVAFSDNGVVIPSCGAVLITWSASASQGTANCVTSALAGGSHNIVANYSGDTNYVGSGNYVVQTVTPAGGTMKLSSSSTGNSSAVNQPVTFTVTITPSTGNTNVLLSGTVTLTDGSGPVAGCTVSFSVDKSTGVGTATCTTSSLALGSHAITATYSNDQSFSFTPQVLTQTVTQAGSSVALCSSTQTNCTGASSSTVNQQVIFTATVTPAAPSNPGPAAPSGSVTFTANQGGSNTTLCANAALTPSTGLATCSASFSAAGNYTITATYSGDTNFKGSSNATTFTQDVSAASTSITVSSSLNPSTVNQSVQFTANIPVPSGYTPPATAMVTFTDTSTSSTICTVSTASGLTKSSSTDWVATCSDSTLTASAAPQTITATYSGDTNLSVSAGTLPQTVNKAATTLNVVSGQNPSQVNAAVTFTATVTPNPSGAAAPTGTVSFTDSVNGAISGCSTVQVSPAGIASCTTSTLKVDATNGGADVPHVITATYSGDANFSGNTGKVNQSVEANAETITFVAGTPTSSTVNQSVTFTSGFPAPASGTVPTGTVVYTDNGGTISGCTGLAPSLQQTVYETSCSDSQFKAGVHTIVATYGGDSNLNVVSGSTTLTVAPASSQLALVSSSPMAGTPPNPTSVVGTQVTFTATVSPASGPIALSGNVTFTDNGTVICSMVDVSASGVASCPTSALASGPNSITAAYSNDLNFTASSGTLQQNVQDFSLTIASTPPVIVSQGFTTSSDPYSHQTISVTPVPLEAYATAPGVPLKVSCAVTTPSGTAVSAPVCNLYEPGSTAICNVQGGTCTLPVSGSGGQEAMNLVVDASSASAAPGSYVVKVTGTDPTTGISHPATVNVSVRAVSSVLQVISGATSGNSGNVTFILPAGVTVANLSNSSCVSISGTGIPGPETLAQANIGISCASFSPTSVGSSASTSQQTVTSSVTINTNGAISSTASRLNPGTGRSSVLIAGVLGIPFLGLIGFLRRRALRTGLLSLLALIALGVALLQTMGCGGSYHSSPTQVSGGTTPPGVYYILIQGTGSDGNVYSAVLQLDVEL